MRSVGNHPPQKLCLERAVALLEEQRGNYNLIDILPLNNLSSAVSVWWCTCG